MNNSSSAEAVSAAYKTVPDVVAGMIHDRIMSGELTPGTHLRLSELAAEFDISQMPVREALRRLESLGLVEIHAHRGAFVRTLSAKDFDDTMEVRMILERTAVERAALHFTTEAAAQARELLAEHNRLHEVGEEIAAREVHTKLHHFLYRAAGSEWLLRAIDPVWRNSERYRFSLAGSHNTQESAREHEELIAACESGNSERAGEALLKHLSSASARMTLGINSRQASSEDSS